MLFDYSKIYAPFSGVITQRFANFGTLVQAGTSSSTNVLPIAKLSEDDKFRLVIPVPESYVKFIHIGDAVDVHVPSLDRHFPGTVASLFNRHSTGYANHAHRSGCAQPQPRIDPRALCGRDHYAGAEE